MKSNVKSKIFEKLDRDTHTPLHLKTRARIILLAADGINNTQIAKRENLNRNLMQKWHNRWADGQEIIHQTEHIP